MKTCPFTRSTCTVWARLPRGEGLLIPFFCDVFVGEPMYWTGDKADFVSQLSCRIKALVEEGHFADWQ